MLNLVKKLSDDPYKLPESIFCFINVSGGRTSAYMLKKILDRYNGKLPDNCEAVFANTGKEYPETLDFLNDITLNYNVPITWLEYDYDPTRTGYKNDPRHIHRVVDYKTASRNGEPFEKLIDFRKRLPNIYQRYCTQILKIKTIERYAKRELKVNSFCNVIGIRYDEQKRIMKGLETMCAIVYPLALAGIKKEDIDNYWLNSPFDLAIHSDLSNCDLCFLKSKKQLVEIMQKTPEVADWWIKQEEKINYTFIRRKGHDYKTLRENFGGEFSDDDEKRVSCFCGD